MYFYIIHTSDSFCVLLISHIYIQRAKCFRYVKDKQGQSLCLPVHWHGASYLESQVCFTYSYPSWVFMLSEPPESPQEVQGLPAGRGRTSEHLVTTLGGLVLPVYCTWGTTHHSEVTNHERVHWSNTILNKKQVLHIDRLKKKISTMKLHHEERPRRMTLLLPVTITIWNFGFQNGIICVLSHWKNTLHKIIRKKTKGEINIT